MRTTTLLLLILGILGVQACRPLGPIHPDPGYPTRTPTLSPQATFTPTPDPTLPPLTPTFTPPLILTGSPTKTGTTTRTATATSTSTNTGGITRTSTATPTRTATCPCGTSPTFTLTPIPPMTLSPTMTGTPSSTPTAATGCSTLGTHDAAPVTFASLPADSYVANAYPAGALCGTLFDQIEVYVSNISPYSATMELAVYDDTTQLVRVSPLVPASFTGWLTVPIPPVTIACGHSAILAAHGLSYGPTVGVSASSGCRAASGIYIGIMPASFPMPGILTAPATGPCYEMNLSACGP